MLCPPFNVLLSSCVEKTPKSVDIFPQHLRFWSRPRTPRDGMEQVRSIDITHYIYICATDAARANAPTKAQRMSMTQRRSRFWVDPDAIGQRH
jgi:hypothetical protein